MKEQSEHTTEKKTSRKKSRVRSIFGMVLYIVVFFGLIFGTPRFLSWMLKTPYPMAAITSGSMWPALKEGDLVFIKGVKSIDEIYPKDIIVFRNEVNNTLTIHRVKTVDREKGKIVTRGDANFTDDKPIVFRDIVGKSLTLSGRTIRVPYLGVISVTAANIKQKPE